MGSLSAVVSCLLLMHLSSGNAIMCYVCEYNSFFGNGATCQGPTVGDSHLKDCGPGIDKCASLFIKTPVAGRVHVTVNRICLNSTNPPRCIYGATDACSCNTDRCNNIRDAPPPPPPQPSSASSPSSQSSTHASVTPASGPSTTSGAATTRPGRAIVAISFLCFFTKGVIVGWF